MLNGSGVYNSIISLHVAGMPLIKAPTPCVKPVVGLVDINGKQRTLTTQGARKDGEYNILFSMGRIERVQYSLFYWVN